MSDASRAPRPESQDAPTLPADLVPVIAVHLDEAGEYRAVLDPNAPQQLVDLRWAALRAGRILGRKVKVTTTHAIGSGAPVLARVTFAAPHGPKIPRQREPE